jgi:uncharacterized PurR-regulated membrane protein YhhQ (DUF165 family)
MNSYGLRAAYAAMVAAVMASNFLVLFPINDWLTCGAFTYPFTFLITELTNRFYGPKTARRVVFSGFLLGAFLSIWLATPRIAFASGSAFLIAQLLDISVFNRFRQMKWWYAPLLSSLAASLVDTVLFWNIAFLGEPVPLLTWTLGDFSVKLLMDVAMLTPFRLAIRRSAPVPLQNS